MSSSIVDNNNNINGYTTLYYGSSKEYNRGDIIRPYEIESFNGQFVILATISIFWAMGLSLRQKNNLFDDHIHMYISGAGSGKVNSFLITEKTNDSFNIIYNTKSFVYVVRGKTFRSNENKFLSNMPDFEFISDDPVEIMDIIRIENLNDALKYNARSFCTDRDGLKYYQFVTTLEYREKQTEIKMDEQHVDNFLYHILPGIIFILYICVILYF